MPPTCQNSDMILLRALNTTEEVAARNAGEFFVDKIVDHTGNVRRRSHMTFRVRWKGYTPDDDTWQPIKTVRETQAFVDYCREKTVSSMVSKRCVLRALTHACSTPRSTYIVLKVGLKSR
jgi:hypothetical protein